MIKKHSRTIRRFINMLFATVLILAISKTAYADGGETVVSAVDTICLVLLAVGFLAANIQTTR